MKERAAGGRDIVEASGGVLAGPAAGGRGGCGGGADGGERGAAGQRQVSRRQVPRGAERVDGANPGTDDAHPNIRFNDWRSALNQDGTWGHGDGSYANLTSKTIQWLQWGKYSTETYQSPYGSFQVH